MAAIALTSAAFRAPILEASLPSPLALFYSGTTAAATRRSRKTMSTSKCATHVARSVFPTTCSPSQTVFLTRVHSVSTLFSLSLAPGTNDRLNKVETECTRVRKTVCEGEQVVGKTDLAT